MIGIRHTLGQISLASQPASRVLLTLARVLLCIALSAFPLSGCVITRHDFESDALVGSGMRQDYVVTTSEFSGIVVDGFAVHIEYHWALDYSIFIKMQPSLYELLSIDNSDGVFTFQASSDITWYDEEVTTIVISAPSMGSLAGNRHVQFDTFDRLVADSFDLRATDTFQGEVDLSVNSLRVELTGFYPYLNLTGEADSAEFILNQGTVYGKGFQTRSCVAYLSENGNLQVSCSEYLEIKPESHGIIDLVGDPFIENTEEGGVSIYKEQ